MSNSGIVAIGLLSSFLLVGSPLRAQGDAAHAGQDAADAQHEVVAVLEATFAATESADYAALDELFAEDVTIIEGAGINRTWADYRDNHLKPELEEFESFSYQPREIEARVIGDWAWAIFEYDLEIKMGEREIDRVGRGTAILERRDGRWVIQHMQTANRPRQ